MSLYGIFEQALLLGVLASSSIILSAVFTMYAAQRIIFGGSFSKMFTVNIPDLNKREFFMLLILVLFTIILGIYPSIILDGLHYYTFYLLYNIYYI